VVRLLREWLSSRGARRLRCEVTVVVEFARLARGFKRFQVFFDTVGAMLTARDYSFTAAHSAGNPLTNFAVSIPTT
jgi:hypothetical protein